MSGVIYERIARESEIAHRWWQLPSQTLLSLVDGQLCLLIYAGEPGGPAGPDVRDAVLYFFPRKASPAEVALAASGDEASSPAARLVGDVEFHIRTSDWFAHGHHTDPLYNRVLLHVILYPDSEIPTRRQDGAEIPVCSLLDLPRVPFQAQPWPCEQQPPGAMITTTTLLYAGLLRFNAKSWSLVEVLAKTLPGSAFSAYDTCLIPALAEALGYGRDRAFFRAAGMRLVGLPARVPEPLSHAWHPAPLDVRRLRILSILNYALAQGWSLEHASAGLAARSECQERSCSPTRGLSPSQPGTD